MHPVNELKQLREQMIERLTRIPEYRALKAIERFIGELSSIYEAGGEQIPAEQPATQATPAPTAQPAAKQAPTVIENRFKSDGASAASPRVTPYIPAHRVA